MARGLAGLPLLTTAVRMPALAATPQTASAYGSIMASVRPGQLTYRSDPFPLSDAVRELQAAMNAEAERLARKRLSLLGLLSNLLNSLLGLVTQLFTGSSTVSQLRTQDPDLYRFLENYRSALWPVSPVTTFSVAIAPLQSLGSKTLLDVAVDKSSPLGQLFVTALLNSTNGTRIDAELLWPERVRTIAYELNSKGYFEPTAGVRWDSLKVMEWWKISLGLRV